MSKDRESNRDPFRDIREWQDHRYDPGYFTGGRIHPILKGRRPNRYGWLLLASGLVGFAFIFARSDGGDFAWWQYVLGAAYGLLYVVAGFKLLRRQPDPPQRSSSHHRHHRTRKGHP